MLYSYSSDAMRANRWPAAWDRAFCAAVNNDDLLKCRAEAAGYRVIGREEIQLLELGRQYLKHKRAAASIDRIEEMLGEIEL